MEYYSAIKKNDIWIDFEGIMLSEISQTEKDKYYIISLIYTQQTSEYNKKRSRLRNTENKLLVTSREREGVGAR